LNQLSSYFTLLALLMIHRPKNQTAQPLLHPIEEGEEQAPPSLAVLKNVAKGGDNENSPPVWWAIASFSASLFQPFDKINQIKPREKTD